jgi:hypothetical protein
MLGITVADVLTHAVMGDKPGVEKPTTRLSEMPFIRNFFVNTDNNAILNGVYKDVITKPEMAKKQFTKYLEEDYDADKALEYQASHPEMAYADFAQRLSKDIGETAKLIRQVTNMPGMSAADKRSVLDSLQDVMRSKGKMAAEYRQAMRP